MNTAVEPAPDDRPAPLWRHILVGRNPRRTLFRLLVLVSVSYIIIEFVIIPIRVTGSSMAPTYVNGKINLINRLSYRLHPPQRGDVVAIKVMEPDTVFLKRVIALPGETVEFKRGQVYVNGQPLDEPYIKLHGFQSYAPFPLAPGWYCLAGDNRSVTVIGAAPGTNILGKVLF